MKMPGARKRPRGPAAEARRLAKKGHARYLVVPFLAWIVFGVSVLGVSSLGAAGWYGAAAVELRQPGQAGSPILDATRLYSDPPAFLPCAYPCEVNPLDMLRPGFYSHGSLPGLHFTLREPRGLFMYGTPPCQGLCCFYCQRGVCGGA